MVNPADKEMKKQWITVDGRQTLIILPQIWDHEKENWVVTSGKDPLPVNVENQTNEIDFPEDYPDEAVKTELESIKATQAEILERLDGTFDTQLTGSNVEYPFVDNDYEGGVLNTRTMGLSWKSFNLFNGNSTIPAGAYLNSEGDAFPVNGYSTIGIIIRDVRAGGIANHDIGLAIYWQGSQGKVSTRTAVNEVFRHLEDDAGTGFALSVPTKSEYVWFRVFNRSDEDVTYYAKGLLRP